MNTMKIPITRELKIALKKRKRAVWKRDNWTCRYCGLDMNGDMIDKKLRMPMSRITVDHVYPRRFGGSDDIENLVTSCFECNSKKGDSMFDWKPIELSPIEDKKD